MKKKTKWLALVLCIVLTASMAFGCGSSDPEDQKDITSASSEEEGAASEKEEKEEKTSEADISIKKQVLVDQDDIVITATEYVMDSLMGDGINLLIENKSDADVTVGCNALIVNDYMITDLFSADIAAGKKSNETVYLSSSELEAAGIDTVGKVEIYFHVYDSDSWDDLFDTDCVTIETSEIKNMDTSPNDEGKELYNAGGIRIVGKTVDEDSFWGSAILLYCENTSGKNVGISVDDMSVNGFMMSPYFSTEIYDGKKAITDITILSSDLEDNGIETIEEVELKFDIYESESYDTIAESDTITFSAK